MKLAQNPAFYKSVHLGGVENLRLQKETLEEEKVAKESVASFGLISGADLSMPPQAEWLAKVVVDSLDFKLTRMVVKDKPLQLDRATDILTGAAQKQFFRKLRKAYQISGKVRRLDRST